MNKQKIKPKILVYQDELCPELLEYLEVCEFEILNTDNSNVHELIREAAYDLCLFSHYKTSAQGDLRLLMEVRKIKPEMPVIIISSLVRYDFAVQAFDYGADDYVIRPYNFEILVKKINVLLRRSELRLRDVRNLYDLGIYTFDVDNRVISMEGEQHDIRLTSKECKILAMLCAQANEVIPTEVIMSNIYEGPTYFNARSLAVHITRLRSYLKMDKNITIEHKSFRDDFAEWKQGYSLAIKEE